MKVLAVLIAAAIVLVLVPLLMWSLNSAFGRRARRLQAQFPHAWVRPMGFGRSGVVVVIEPEQLRLVGLFGRTVQEYPRRELAGAEVGTARFPLARRRCLALRFTNGFTWELLTMRRGGFASSVPDAESALAYLDGHPAKEGD